MHVKICKCGGIQKENCQKNKHDYVDNEQVNVYAFVCMYVCMHVCMYVCMDFSYTCRFYSECYFYPKVIVL